MPSIIWAILIGLVAGWMGGLIMRGRGFGFFGDILVGIVGAILGSFLFSFLGITAAGLLGELLMATIGAIVLLFLIGLIPRSETPAVG